MRWTAITAVLVSLSVVSSASAESTPPRYEQALRRAEEGMKVLPEETLKNIIEQAVPSTDSSTGQLVGKVIVNSGRINVSGVSTVILILEQRIGRLNQDVWAYCYTTMIPKCAAIRAGKRVRLSGSIFSVPDLESETGEFLPFYVFAVSRIES